VDHERNLAEKAAIFALAFRAGLAKGQNFSVEPAILDTDRHSGTDLFLHHNGSFLRIDLTDSRKFTGPKITRAVRFAHHGGRWVYVLKVDWLSAVGVVTDKCFNPAYDLLIKDGQRLALEQACPDHGNTCGLAGKLFQLSCELNVLLAASETEAHLFAIEVPTLRSK